MRPKPAILDDEYFKRKQIEREYERNRTRFLPAFYYTPQQEEEKLRYAVDRLAKSYFNNDQMDAAKFEESLDAKLKRYKGQMCPSAHFGKDAVKLPKSTKKATTVGEVLLSASMISVLIPTMLAVVVYLVLNLVGVA